MRLRLAGAAAALAVIAVITTACSPEADLEPVPTASADAAVPSETPTPTPTPTAFVPSCLNIISTDTIETLEAEGFVLIDGYENKLRVEGRVEAMFFDNGGVDCLWGVQGGGDSLVAFGYSEISPPDALYAQEELSAAGYVRTEESGDIVLSIDPADDVMGIGDVFVFSANEWFHSTNREAVAEMRQHIN
jgi:hypothetical protein